jgi:hypothetical protein
MKISKQQLQDIILQEAYKALRPVEPETTPRDKLIMLLQECSLALDLASDTYKELGELELENKYMKLGERAHKAANYLAKLP